MTEHAQESLAQARPGLLDVSLPQRLFVPIPESDGITLGARVARGQTLGAAAPLGRWIAVAPASGTLVALREVELTTGQRCSAVEIEVDSSQPDEPAPEPATDSTDLVSRIIRAGIWADRRTSPDLVAQLRSAIVRPVETVLCNLLEADGAPLNAAVAMVAGPAMLRGLVRLAQAVNAARVHVVVDSDTATVLDSIVGDLNERPQIRIIQLSNDYPQADPTILLYMLTGRKLRPGRLPVEQGVLMLDGPAGRAVARLLDGHEPMIDVPLAVRNRGAGHVHLVSAAVGTPLRFVLENLGISTTGITIRAGAVLRDVRIGPDAIIAGGELRVDVAPTTMPTNPDPCIRCGWCVAACPTRVNPAGILDAAQQQNPALAEHYGIEACIECGVCSYVCPSRLPLLGAIRMMNRD